MLETSHPFLLPIRQAGPGGGKGSLLEGRGGAWAGGPGHKMHLGAGGDTGHLGVRVVAGRRGLQSPTWLGLQPGPGPLGT